MRHSLFPITPLPTPRLKLASIRRISGIHPAFSALAPLLAPFFSPAPMVADLASSPRPFLPVLLLVHPGESGFLTLFGGVELAPVCSELLEDWKDARAPALVYPRDIDDTLRRRIIFQQWLLTQKMRPLHSRTSRETVAGAMGLAAACGIPRAHYTMDQVAEFFGTSTRTAKRASEQMRKCQVAQPAEAPQDQLPQS